jgi:exopolysaccharide biosynthesis protein
MFKFVVIGDDSRKKQGMLLVISQGVASVSKMLIRSGFKLPQFLNHVDINLVHSKLAIGKRLLVADTGFS